MKLVSKIDGHEIKVGEIVKNSRGENRKIISVRQGSPREDGQTGYVYTYIEVLCPDVCDLEWVK